MNNILDPKGNEHNFEFLASVIAVLCESSPITVSIEDIKRFWNGEIQRLKYDMSTDGNTGSITFSLKEKDA